MGPGGAPEEAVAGIRAVGGGLQSQIHHPQYEIKQPRCGWEVGMAGRGGPAPAPHPGPSSGYKPPIQSRVAAGFWPLKLKPAISPATGLHEVKSGVSESQR
jgi:hypothetical protein